MSASPFPALRIVTSVLEGSAILLTLFRMWYRFSIRRFSWEDAWAAIAMLCAIACLVSYWVQLEAPGRISIIAFWVYSLSFACVVWAVRMSVLCSITRLIHPATTSRLISLSVTALFTLLWGGIVVWKAVRCGSNRDWYHSSSRSCPMPRSNDIYELSTDVVSDTILVVLPLRMLWDVKLPTKHQRRMILCIFSSSIIVSLTSLFRAIYRLTHKGSLTITTSNFEVALCLIVCNLLVVVTYLYRVFRKSEDGDDSDSDTENSGNSESHPHTSPVTALYLTTASVKSRSSYLSLS
ncbi:hypothetical protein BV22DRAFT_1095167 [Leucogyrophana mollusca]|uniref:Uncharacterized protein n=1 Tax=Leucogyrophana mollusca TaxID=85980 RepID=A0ACB8BBC7_9AGAM|nr:hypothetical protein BV22DRAFT_1095167 [Leucogyrophana mollusca]